MKLIRVFSCFLMGLAVTQSQAFSSLNLNFAQSQPKDINIEFKVSTGDCSVPTNSVSCHTNFLNTTLPVVATDGTPVVTRFLQAFNQDYRNKIVENPVE